LKSTTDGTQFHKASDASSRSPDGAEPVTAPEAPDSGGHTGVGELHVLEQSPCGTSPPEPPAPLRTTLVVPHGMAWYAELHGAVFDKGQQVWAVHGEVPAELANFLPQPLRPEARRLPESLCPLCRMHMRKVRSRHGDEFWGCSALRRTGCKGTLSLERHLDLLASPSAPTALDVLATPSHMTTSAARSPPRPAKASHDPTLERSIRKIAEVARKLFGAGDQAWVDRPMVTLGNETPAKLLRTAEGRRTVLEALIKLRDYG